MTGNAPHLFARRLGITVLRTEGNDLVGACPNPACKSSDAFRLHKEKGLGWCHSCHAKWSPFDLAKQICGDPVKAKELLQEFGLWHGVAVATGLASSPSSDPIGDVARAKGVSRESFIAYGAKAVSSSPAKVVIPMYGPERNQCSTMTIAETGKGRYSKDLPVGMFFPHEDGEVRWPIAGDPMWCIGEGPKDPARMHGEGIYAAGLPGASLNPKFAPLFVGVDVVLMPSTDNAGASGAEKSAVALHGKAKSVRIATLPFERTDSGGKDVRDTLKLPDGKALLQKAIEEAILVGKDGKPIPPARTIEMIDSKTFAATDYPQRYRIKRILVDGQPAIIGGRSKTLKTSLAIELVVSIGTGTPFLNEFESRKGRVGLISGESGGFTIQETARRVCDSKGLNLADVDALWGFDLPQLAVSDDMFALANTIEEQEIDVMVIDPAYLCLLGGDTQGRNASNLFDMGPLLLNLSQVGIQTKCTIVLLHHCRKNGPEPFTVPELEELSMAGFAEWARQWLLLGRREAYDKGSGMHKLWLNIGGSAGHSGCYGLDINEGQLDDDFRGRHWSVSVVDAYEANSSAKEARHKNAEQRAEESAQRYLESDRSQIVKALLKFPDGETKSVIRDAAGVKTTRIGAALSSLVMDGQVVPCQLLKGNRKTPIDGFKLARVGGET